MDHRQNMRSYIGGLSSYDTADLFLVHWLEHFIISIDRTLLMHILMVHIGKNKANMVALIPHICSIITFMKCFHLSILVFCTKIYKYYKYAKIIAY